MHKKLLIQSKSKFKKNYFENLANNASLTHFGTNAEISPPFFETSLTTEELR